MEPKPIKSRLEISMLTGISLMAVFMLITLEITAVRGMPIAVPANVPVRPESSPTVKKWKVFVYSAYQDSLR